MADFAQLGHSAANDHNFTVTCAFSSTTAFARSGGTPSAYRTAQVTGFVPMRGAVQVKSQVAVPPARIAHDTECPRASEAQASGEV